MKTTKIVMGMAAAAVMALSLTGCIMPGKSLGFTEIKVDGSNDNSIGQIAKGTIDFTNNDPNKYCRGIQLFSNKKKGITTKIELQNLTENTSNPGVMGIAFDFTQNNHADDRTDDAAIDGNASLPDGKHRPEIVGVVFPGKGYVVNPCAENGKGGNPEHAV